MTVIQQAKYFATILEADPIMASQIKEHCPPRRLAELLDIEPDAPEVVTVESFPDSVLVEALMSRWASLTPFHQKQIRDVSFPFKQ